MASGGHYPRSLPTNGAPANNRPRGDNEGENESQGPPWLLTANNLSLHTSAAENRLSKKQRNKSKPKLIPVTDTSPSTESSPQASGVHRPTPILPKPVTKLSVYHNKKDEVGGENSRYSKMPSDLDQDGSDTDESGAEPIRNFKYPVNQRRQKKNIHNGLGPKKAAENLPNISYKQDNTNKLPDTSVLVERLMHLRDCIKQVSTIMQNMEKADGPVMRSQLGNLDQMLEQLKSEESEQLELLQQVLAAKEGASAAASSAHRNETATADLDSSTSTIEYEPEPVQPNGNEDEDEEIEETSEAIEKRNELLQKMVASQKKLVALKEQQSALLNMQKKAESRLAEVKAFHEQLLEAGQSNDVEYNGLLSLIQNGPPSQPNADVNNRSRNSSAPMSHVSNGTPEWDLAVNQNCSQVSKGNVKLHRKEIKKSSSGSSVNQALASINTGEIQTLHSRLRALQEFANNKPMKDEPSSNPVDEQAAALSDSHRKKLENKLRELQEKKNQMDSLLAELSMHVTTQANGISDVSLDSNQASGVNLNTEFSPETDNAIAEARQYIESVNSGEKNRQMEDLKKKIKHLKLLAENVEATSPALEDDNQAAQGDNSQWRGRYPVNKRDHKSQGPVLKSDNIRRDHTAPGFPARRHYEAEGRANEDPDNTAAAQAPAPNTIATVMNTASASASPSTPLTSSQEQSIMEEHAEIEDKVSKLLVAKIKLEKLQSLLGAVHQFRQSGEPLPNDIVQFIATLQPGFEGLNDLSPVDGNRTADDEETSQRNVPNQDLARLNDVEDQLMRQQNELDHLAEERKRLLTMKEQLRVLQQHQNAVAVAAAAAGKNNERRSSGEGGSVTRKDRNASNLLTAAAPVPEVIISRTSRTRIAHEDNLQRSRACSMENTRTTKDTNSKAANSVNVSRNHPVKYESQPERIDERSLAQLHDELSQSLALRDELQHQKVVLQELLRQEQSKQMGFSQNQDLRSQSGSSEKSELVEGGSSVLAPDTTVAATWGGSSTQDNLDDEAEEEPLESLEEQDEDEGSDTTDLKQTDAARVQQLLRPFVEEESMIDRQRRSVRQCRVHGYKRGLLNQWRKNYQPPPVANKKNEQAAGFQQSRQENVQVENMSVEDGVDAANSDGRRRQFTKFFQQQLDQTNTLCQNVLKDQQALSGMLLSCSVSNQPMMTGQNNPPDMMRYYSQMFQQQQQLLLSLSHCYHLLYMQQLEIFQLHQYIQQSSESEGIAMPHSSPNDEFNFRPPWCMTPWLNHPSPTLQTPFMAPPAAPFCFNPAPHPSAPPPIPSFPLNSGGGVVIPPPPQVTPTAAQDERGATETLNNQVPPGLRANNFLDNFKSYSRQNLLSGAPATVTAKSNESSSSVTLNSTLTTSQMRPSYTFCATSDSTRVPRARELPNFPGSYSLPSIPSSGRRSLTPSASPQANNSGGARPRTFKRPNLNQEQGNGGNRRAPASLNLLGSAKHAPSVMPETSITSRPVEFEATPQPPENLESLRDSIYMEVTSLISSYEQQPEMLADLLKKLQNIGSSPPSIINNQSWNALTTIKELMQLRDVNVSSSGLRRKGELRNKAQTAAHNPTTLSEFARSRLPESQPDNNIFTRDNVENTAVRLSEHINESPVDESSSSSTSWPKNTSSTGAIQKKYSRHFVCSANSNAFNTGGAASESSQEASSSSLSSDQQVKQAILNLVPYLQNHLLDECTLHLQAQLCGHVMNALQTLPVHQQSLRFFRSQLLQTMQQTLAKYLGKRVRDCEEDMLMELSEVVLKELALHKITHKKIDDSVDWLSFDNNSLPVRNETTTSHVTLLSSESALQSRLEFDSPQSHEGRFLGSEGFSENELFNNDVKNTIADHRDWTEVADTIHGGGGQISSESSVESSSQRSHMDIQPDRLDVRAAPDGIAAAPPALVLPLSPRLLEEESGYDCDAEGETEPEVEAENDDTKNLAEADQSAGQLGSLPPHCLRDGAVGGGGGVSNNSRNPLRSLSPHNASKDDRQDGGGGGGHLLNGEIVNMEDLGATGAEALSQGQTSAAEGEELSLDDIPTKLETLTPDELRRQITDEQASNSIIQEIVSDSHSIVGDKDNAKDPGAL